jgi:hypothetical protein
VIRERTLSPGSGHLALGLLLPLVLVFGWVFVTGVQAESPVRIIAALVCEALTVFLLSGLFMIEPNESRVLQLFGNDRGTAVEPGLRCANPFSSKRRVSVRIRKGQRRRRQSGRDCDGRRLEGRRHGRGSLRGGRLRA